MNLVLMGTPPAWLFFAVWIGAVLLVSVNLALFLRVRVRQRVAEHLVSKAAALDVLLATLCERAFVLQHAPIWLAWTQTMGSFEVEVTRTRTIPRAAGQQSTKE